MGAFCALVRRSAACCGQRGAPCCASHFVLGVAKPLCGAARREGTCGGGGVRYAVLGYGGLCAESGRPAQVAGATAGAVFLRPVTKALLGPAQTE